MEIIEEGEENMKVARVLVAENQLSLAIGKKGQNSRLAARLCGVKIDIHTEPTEIDEFEEYEEDTAFNDSFEDEVEESAFAGLHEED